MAAPSSAYLLDGLSLPAKEEDLSGGVLATFHHYVPRKLYGTIANTCAIFYLDGIEQDINIEDLSGNILESGFLGYCIVGSDNYYMHAAARRGKLNGSLFDSAEVKLNDRIYFNDGSLNTFGFSSGITAVSDLGNGGAKISALYKAAYFLDTSFHLQVTRGAEAPAIIFLKDLLQNTSFNEVNKIVNLFDTYDVHAGQTITFKVITNNAEGWWDKGATHTITIQPYAKNYKYGTTPKSSYEAPGLTEVWLGSYRPDLGTILYAHIGMGARMPAGYYMNTSNDDYLEIDSNGTVISKNTYVPAVPLNYLAYGIRTGTGSDFGSYEVRVRIINDQIAAQLSSPATIKLGMLINPAGAVTESNMSVQATHLFTSVSVPALDESDRTQYGSVAQPYSGYTWAYVLIVDGVELGSGIFMI